MANESAKIDINAAGLEELTSVSGIGPGLAERIIVERPYGSVDGLLNVPGIGKSLLARIEPYLMVAEEGMYETGDEAILSGTIEEGEDYVEPDPYALESETVEAEILEPEEVPPQTARRAVPVGKPISRDEEVRQPRSQPVDKALLKVPQPGEASEKKTNMKNNQENLIYAVLIGVVVLMLSVFLTLGILGVVNRGLSYVPVRDYKDLRVQVDTLTNESEALRQDVDALQERMDSLETLSGRVTELEDSTESMVEDVDTVMERMDELESKVQAYDDTIADLEQRTSTFQQFLEDLRTMLIQLVPVDTIK